MANYPCRGHQLQLPSGPIAFFVVTALGPREAALPAWWPRVLYWSSKWASSPGQEYWWTRFWSLQKYVSYKNTVILENSDLVGLIWACLEDLLFIRICTKLCLGMINRLPNFYEARHIRKQLSSYAMSKKTLVFTEIVTISSMSTTTDHKIGKPLSAKFITDSL